MSEVNLSLAMDTTPFVNAMSNARTSAIASFAAMRSAGAVPIISQLTAGAMAIQKANSLSGFAMADSLAFRSQITGSVPTVASDNANRARMVSETGGVLALLARKDEEKAGLAAAIKADNTLRSNMLKYANQNALEAASAFLKLGPAAKEAETRLFGMATAGMNVKEIFRSLGRLVLGEEKIGIAMRLISNPITIIAGASIGAAVGIYKIFSAVTEGYAAATAKLRAYVDVAERAERLLGKTTAQRIKGAQFEAKLQLSAGDTEFDPVSQLAKMNKDASKEEQIENTRRMIAKTDDEIKRLKDDWDKANAAVTAYNEQVNSIDNLTKDLPSLREQLKVAKKAFWTKSKQDGMFDVSSVAVKEKSRLQAGDDILRLQKLIAQNNALLEPSAAESAKTEGRLDNIESKRTKAIEARNKLTGMLNEPGAKDNLLKDTESKSSRPSIPANSLESIGAIFSGSSVGVNDYQQSIAGYTKRTAEILEKHFIGRGADLNPGAFANLA
jgi:archaellum component FlaC